jgi:hypothetical protein
MENVCCDCMYNSFVEHIQEVCVEKYSEMAAVWICNTLGD